MNLPEFSVKQSLFINLLSLFFIIAGIILAFEAWIIYEGWLVFRKKSTADMTGTELAGQ